MSRPWLRYTCLLAALLSAPSLSAAELRIAVAANFSEAMRQLAEGFSRHSGHRLQLSVGSTGKHYAQIRHGAPFDLFFAADSRRPQLLEQEGRAVMGSRFTYARGQLVLWSPQPGVVDEAGQVLREGGFSHLAIANPKLAPYGAAARAVLEQLGLWQGLQPRLVRGENIGQTYQFVLSGSAQLGFVALSQVQRPATAIAGSYWRIPLAMYPAIDQQAVLLRDSPQAREFMAYVRGAEAAALIRGFGYRLDGDDQ